MAKPSWRRTARPPSVRVSSAISGPAENQEISPRSNSSSKPAQIRHAQHFSRHPRRLACISPTRSDAAQIAQLLSGTYWNTHVTTRDIEAGHLGSSAWVVARDDRGSPIASARAISDTTKHAWIYDVIVSPDWRRKHIGDAVLRLLLDHPRVRAAKRVHLGTRDAQGFYARMGLCT